MERGDRRKRLEIWHCRIRETRKFRGNQESAEYGQTQETFQSKVRCLEKLQTHGKNPKTVVEGKKKKTKNNGNSRTSKFIGKKASGTGFWWSGGIGPGGVPGRRLSC